MFDEIEYVDPAESMCDECGCSFGIHLMTCSKFKPQPAPPEPQVTPYPPTERKIMTTEASEVFHGLSVDLTNCLQNRNQELSEARSAISRLITVMFLMQSGVPEADAHGAIVQGREWLANYNKRFPNRQAPHETKPIHL